MIHFFVKDSPTTDLPFISEFKTYGIPFRVFGGYVPFEYRSRIMILLKGYPKLLCYAARAFFRSMSSGARPNTVVLQSDVEILVFSAMKMLVPWIRFNIVFIGFIYTGRSSMVHSKLRNLYYSLVLRNCARIICHSNTERERYGKIFPRVARRFVFMPWGSNIWGWDTIDMQDQESSEDRPFRVLAAGRSGRDYPTLSKAVSGEDLDVTIICDNRESLGGVIETANLRILRDCYGECYLEQLRRCDAVVVPLTVDDISAGQMVIIQAMAYAKPIIVTRTPTIEEYVIEGEEGLMVRRGDYDELRGAIRQLRDDPILYSRLRSGARNAYERRYNQAAYTRNLVHVLTDL
jgi:glycosyltransferase involved in cell wall biosynthesis